MRQYFMIRIRADNHYTPVTYRHRSVSVPILLLSDKHDYSKNGRTDTSDRPNMRYLQHFP